ncbi:hypothetical protein RM700_045 [Saccharomyces cerevisiae synthetic construct]|uniref:Putative uncharacterized protein YKL177W n=2 Tax=Saccharomyces cerevisiae TaxID=4932 RepID=YKR7_YEAST|nr:RecName: Full=Putative uncharacterized protein YKL177W [Saccharomyces cerevisiae S288C]AAS56686.1 YKL177W [Saccharomyces cerevisiae]WNV94128.1 hypothetical protein RM700_045 [Saccharomyces cerevisiae synthetic construct]CAY80914.1 EC1118_1K5_0463p [Saccharomyces cerevisiae EC1118]KZV09758.1 hypothetical protein WN66_03800 [Saccharomyces cerevisiae]CAA52260.1 unnamed protein product [Saccharomyces cerevisiae]
MMLVTAHDMPIFAPTCNLMTISHQPLPSHLVRKSSSLHIAASTIHVKFIVRSHVIKMIAGIFLVCECHAKGGANSITASKQSPIIADLYDMKILIVFCLSYTNLIASKVKKQ